MDISGAPALSGAGVATEAQVKVLNTQRSQEETVVGALLQSTKDSAEAVERVRPHSGSLNVVA